MSILSAIDALQLQAVDAVAFYPRSALERALVAGEVRVAEENGEPCGYLWAGPLRPGRDATIYQAVVHYDLRRRMHGARLVADLVAEARAAGCTGVRCRCRSDVEANDFWRALGFSCVGVSAGGSRRRADVNAWRFPVAAGFWDGLGVQASSRPAERSTYHRERLLAPARSRFDRHA